MCGVVSTEVFPWQTPKSIHCQVENVWIKHQKEQEIKPGIDIATDIEWLQNNQSIKAFKVSLCLEVKYQGLVFPE